MKNFTVEGLRIYDLESAIVGDTVIRAYRNILWDNKWSFSKNKIKSVSAKRGDITFDDRVASRYSKDGRKIGEGGSYGRGETYFLCENDETISRINVYLETEKKLNEIGEIVESIQKNSYDIVRSLPDEKIVFLHKTLKELFSDGEKPEDIIIKKKHFEGYRLDSRFLK